MSLGATLSGWAGYSESARFYDLFDRKDSIGFFLKYARRSGQILDVGAGTGRIAIPLAEEGADVWAVEPSPAMLEVFRGKLQERPGLRSRITIVEGEARSFDCGRVFPACILSGSFDHLLDPEERAASLANIGRHLVLGGILVFDVFLGLMSDSPMKPAGRAEAGGMEVRRFVGGKVLPGGRKETWIVFEAYDGDALVDRVHERSLVGVVGREELHELLRAGGFRVQHEWSGYDLAPYQEGDELLILQAIKEA